MMVLPFVLVLLATLTAMLGFRRASLWIWLAALAATIYAFGYHAGGPLNIAL